jgi:hypothetical protein
MLLLNIPRDYTLSVELGRTRKEQAMNVRFDRWLGFSILLASILISLRTHTTQDFSTIDDAFITYRYAANLSNGHGFVYNVGEWVMGTTAPAYGLLLGILGFFTGAEAIPSLSLLVNFIALSLINIGIFASAKMISPSYILNALIAGVIVQGSALHYASISGMETPVFLAVLIWGVVFALWKRWPIALLLIGCTVWFRPEGVFAIGFIGLHLLWQHRDKYLLRRLALLITPGMLLMIWLFVTYGTFIPQSVIAKRAGLYPLSIVDTLIPVSEFVGRDVLGIQGYISPMDGGQSLLRWVLMASVMLSATGVSALWLSRSKASVGWFLPLLGILLTGFFATSSTVLFEHYYGMFEPFLVFTLICAAFAVGARIHPRIGGVTIVILIGLLGTRFDWKNALQGNYPQPTSVHLRMVAYRDLAAQLYDIIPPQTQIAMPEIGELGFWLLHIDVLDTAGLVSPVAVNYMPVPPHQRLSAHYGAVPVELIFDESPEMIISMDVFITPGLMGDGRTLERYEQVMVIDGESWLPWGSRIIQIFVRRDSDLLNRLDGVERWFEGYHPCEAHSLTC